MAVSIAVHSHASHGLFALPLISSTNTANASIEPSSASSQSPHSVSPSHPLTSVLPFVVSASCAAGVARGTLIGEADSNAQALVLLYLPIPRLLLALIVPSCLIGIPHPLPHPTRADPPVIAEKPQISLLSTPPYLRIHVVIKPQVGF